MLKKTLVAATLSMALATSASAIDFDRGEQSAPNTDTQPALNSKASAEEIRQRVQDRLNHSKQQTDSSVESTAATKQVSEEIQQRVQERLNASGNDSDKSQAATDRFNTSMEQATAFAKELKDADDTPANPVCEVVLCMFGKLKGASQSECKSAEKKYFDILVKKRGKIRWSRTAKKRLDFLDGCPSPENGAINAKFGRILGG